MADVSHGKQLAPIGPTQADPNGTPYNETDTFTATTSGTVTLTANVSYAINANVVVAGVTATYGWSVAVAVTASIGNATTLTVPPGKTGYGQYGVWEQVTSGHYYSVTTECTIGVDDGYITTYSPWRVGWNTWEG